MFRISAQADSFGFLDQIYRKKGIFGQKWKSEHHHWILHIRISTGTNFQLKLTALNFWTEFTQKGYFWSETEVNTI